VAALWLGQLFDIDAITAVAAIAREVPDVDLGTAVTITYPRHPIVSPVRPRPPRPPLEACSGSGSGCRIAS
jgi:hypothetical protein